MRGDVGGSRDAADRGDRGGAAAPGSSRRNDRLRVDFHAHTRFSEDAVTSPAALLDRARRAGLDRIAVTDHGTIAGALAARRLDPARVIVGEEIRCSDWTEVIGLFLTRPVDPGQTLEETVDAIRSQGGLVYVPHPYAYLTRARERVRRCMELADCLEVHNARAFWPAWNRRADRAARASGLARCAGSDAHFPGEVGRAYTEIRPFQTAAELRERLATARPGARALTSPLGHLRSLGVKAGRRLLEAVPLARPHPPLEGTRQGAGRPSG